MLANFNHGPFLGGGHFSLKQEALHDLISKVNDTLLDYAEAIQFDMQNDNADLFNTCEDVAQHMFSCDTVRNRGAMVWA